MNKIILRLKNVIIHPTKKQLVVLVIIGITLVMLEIALLIKFNTSSSNGEKKIVNTQKIKKTTPSPVAKLTPTERISVTPVPTIKQYVPPTLTPTLTVSPTTVPTNTPQPTSAPTRVPNPPLMNVSYPQELQYIEMNSGQTLCVVDVPVGGDSTGIKRKHNENDSGWSLYADMFTYCFSPKEGLNRIQFQYKNSYEEESPVLTRQFTFHRTSAD